LHLTVVLRIKLSPTNGRGSKFHAASHSAFVSVKERMNILSDSGEGTGPHVVVAESIEKRPSIKYGKFRGLWVSEFSTRQYPGRWLHDSLMALAGSGSTNKTNRHSNKRGGRQARQGIEKHRPGNSRRVGDPARRLSTGTVKTGQIIEAARLATG
jgi:hypothetical protein